MNQKIRPPSHSSFKKADDDEPEFATAPDIGGRVELGEDAVDASGEAAPAGAFSPLEAAQHRLAMGEPNKLGKPHRDTPAERLLKRYAEALAAYKADYAGTRSERLQKPFLEAKQAMIDAGLMTGDV